jgi:purine-cytosine permease-like protein
VLSIIWLAIGFIFIFFSITYYRYFKNPTQTSVSSEGEQLLSKARATASPTHSLNPLFEDFQRYLESSDGILIARTRIASIGFLLAGIAAFLSALIS